jgi:hypothetical protein
MVTIISKRANIHYLQGLLTTNKSIIQIIKVSINPVSLVVPTEEHGFVVVSSGLFFVSVIHLLTFFSRIFRGRAPSLRTTEWKSLMSNLVPLIVMFD